MDIQDIRNMMRITSIYEIPMRVTYYARVSSEKDEQLNSLDNQISYYENLIRQNIHWTYVPGYIDEGLSGISTKKRKRFNEMIADAKNGEFDLIITKEISRFARNTLDSLHYTRELLRYGVGVFFQNDNINTLDEDAELALALELDVAASAALEAASAAAEPAAEPLLCSASSMMLAVVSPKNEPPLVALLATSSGTTILET